MMKWFKTSKLASHDSFWAALVAFSLLVMIITGALRVFGAIANRQAMLDSGLTSAQLNYLVVYGIIQIVVSLTGLLGMRAAMPLGRALPWFAVILNIMGYWAERLLLWAADQRGGNTIFMIVWHGLWVALMVAFTIKPTIKETDGTRD